MIRPPTISTAMSPLQIICSNGNHQHDQRNRRKAPLLQLHHKYSSNTVVQQSNNVRFSARCSTFRCRWCYLIPPSLMQPIIINNIKQAPPLDVLTPPGDYLLWMEGGENRGGMIGEIISTQWILICNGGGEMGGWYGGWWFGRLTQQSTINKY